MESRHSAPADSIAAFSHTTEPSDTPAVPASCGNAMSGTAK